MGFLVEGSWPVRSKYTLAQLPPLPATLDEAISLDEKQQGKPWTPFQKKMCYHVRDLTMVSMLERMLESANGNLAQPKFIGAIWNPMFANNRIDSVYSFRTRYTYIGSMLPIGEKALINLTNFMTVDIALNILKRVNILPELVLSRCFEMDTTEVRQALAIRPDLAPRHVTELANDYSYAVKSSLAYNEALTEVTMRKLAEDEIGDIREVVATRKDLPQDLALTLARDHDFGVRRAITLNLTVDENTRVLAALSGETFHSSGMSNQSI